MDKGRYGLHLRLLAAQGHPAGLRRAADKERVHGAGVRSARSDRFAGGRFERIQPVPDSAPGEACWVDPDARKLEERLDWTWIVGFFRG